MTASIGENQDPPFDIPEGIKMIVVAGATTIEMDEEIKKLPLKNINALRVAFFQEVLSLCEIEYLAEEVVVKEYDLLDEFQKEDLLVAICSFIAVTIGYCYLSITDQRSFEEKLVVLFDDVMTGYQGGTPDTIIDMVNAVNSEAPGYLLSRYLGSMLRMFKIDLEDLYVKFMQTGEENARAEDD